MKLKSLVTVIAIIFVFTFCNASCSNDNQRVPRQNNENGNNNNSTKMKITIGTTVFTATLYDNPSAAALKAMLPLTVNMTELNSNEKYYDFPSALPANASIGGNLKTGDLALYGNNVLVLFYKTFNTSYSYTKLGYIDNPAGLAAAVGDGNVIVKFENN
ncbi:cyclophilin-like fold protein [Flavobacterium sp. CFBP9031]|uniref:cyclophilin-like fold protein n=1 Tax=Flavobacterium sp. CFBP9031 TaxID=3096538 RepID=UPI002A6B18DB|nr:cyclophilin-like fold protein [Flavobacterium sp. CFBP9031]MDY0989388.1 cyclophilin-like fold protein [Flavobacterium sp. CFBP9031]